ncbi:MAG: hypothetical protein IH944_07440 [Armatimonadetes bacterium]|nr:hypothetical protein [Armatimonadota bacterium]
MSKFFGVVLGLALAGSVLAQGTFTIRRPVDGATVREDVAVRIPKDSIKEGAYIGVLINGKFIEAVLPPIEGDDYVYRLKSKERGIPDGDMEIEIVLFMDFADRAEIVERSSVHVTLDNYTSIKVPEDGFKLRYKFVQGKEMVYRHTITQSVGLLSQAMAQSGSRLGVFPQETEEFSMIYVPDIVEDMGDHYEAVLRMQALPDKGSNYVWLTPLGHTESTKYYDFEMHPVYMRISDVGREVFGAAPPYFAMEGTAGESRRLDLYAVVPLPVLPSKTVLPGDSWTAPYLFSALDLERLAEIDTVTTALTARGELVGVEWQNGIQCAKVRITITAGSREIASVRNLNQQPGEAQSLTLENVYWFALEGGFIVRAESTMTQEMIITVGSAVGGGGAGGGGGRPGVGADSGGGGRPGVGSAGGGSGRTASADEWMNPGSWRYDPGMDSSGNWRFFRRQGSNSADEGAGIGQRGSGGGLAPGGRTGGGSGAVTKQVLRITMQVVTELER